MSHHSIAFLKFDFYYDYIYGLCMYFRCVYCTTASIYFKIHINEPKQYIFYLLAKYKKLMNTT